MSSVVVVPYEWYCYRIVHQIQKRVRHQISLSSTSTVCGLLKMLFELYENINQQKKEGKKRETVLVIPLRHWNNLQGNYNVAIGRGGT